MKNKRNKNTKNGWVIFILIMVAFGMLGVGGIFSAIPVATTDTTQSQASQTQNSSGTTSQTGINIHDLSLSCTSDAFTQYHIHPVLTIFINAVKQAIPANIGITPDCMHPIHTHDGTGTIHIESPAAVDFTLANFFEVWGKRFDKNQILDYKADATHAITMIVDGEPSNDYENLIFKDGQQIVIKYGK